MSASSYSASWRARNHGWLRLIADTEAVAFHLDKSLAGHQHGGRRDREQSWRRGGVLPVPKQAHRMPRPRKCRSGRWLSRFAWRRVGRTVPYRRVARDVEAACRSRNGWREQIAGPSAGRRSQPDCGKRARYAAVKIVTWAPRWASKFAGSTTCAGRPVENAILIERWIRGLFILSGRTALQVENGTR